MAPVVPAVGAISLAAAAASFFTKDASAPKKTSEGITSQWRLEQMIADRICWEKVEHTDKTAFCTVSAKSLPHVPEFQQWIDLLKTICQTEYILWSNMPREQIKNYVLASAALPLVYGARKVDGHRYLDGGIQDNVPVRPLVEAGFTELIVVHLQTEPKDRVTWKSSIKGLDLQHVHIHHVYPNDVQYDIPLKETLWISPKKNQKRMRQGYWAANKWLADVSWT